MQMLLPQLNTAIYHLLYNFAYLLAHCLITVFKEVPLFSFHMLGGEFAHLPQSHLHLIIFPLILRPTLCAATISGFITLTMTLLKWLTK